MSIDSVRSALTAIVSGENVFPFLALSITAYVVNKAVTVAADKANQAWREHKEEKEAQQDQKAQRPPYRDFIVPVK